MSETSLRFTSSDVTIELQGSEDFVERQIQFFRRHLMVDDEAGSAGSNGPESNGAGEGSNGRLPLADFFNERATRAGRGAIQEALLLFGYYLQEVVGQSEFSIDQLGSSFGLVGRPVPKNLHHAVGTLKRKQGWFVPGSRRGTYRIGPAGLKLVRPLG
ncbi:MAG: hypothetical protein ACYTGZ_11730 [Planctomycetota bacterium]|jgi:hypothetical protein